MDKEELQAKLQNEGFKFLFPGLFNGGKIKKSEEVWKGASNKGVAKNEIVRADENDSYYYAIMAFSPKGDIPADIVEELKKRCMELDLGIIRYEAIDISKLEKYRGASWNKENTGVTSLADGFEDIYLFPVSASNKKNLDCLLIVYAISDDIYVYPVPNYVINK